mmetsp:Transcript_20487/g.65062  ORF Transcript_20487/g.65062 Transcript_20487/m.65062 type:complete len:322 (+) Transcript_20487:202-1167(+)
MAFLTAAMPSALGGRAGAVRIHAPAGLAGAPSATVGALGQAGRGAGRRPGLPVGSSSRSRGLPLATPRPRTGLGRASGPLRCTAKAVADGRPQRSTTGGRKAPATLPDIKGSCERENWTPVDPLWEAAVSVAMQKGTMPALISPPWKVMLLSDGSVTRHLQLLTDLPDVHVDCVEMRNIGKPEDLGGLPSAVDMFEGEVVQRQVFLRSDAAGGKALVYAASWWCADTVDEYMTERDEPIWANLASKKLELYRDVQRIYLGHSEQLEEDFGQPGPFWARHYVFWNNGKPLTVIYEVFSKSLESYLGPSCPNSFSSRLGIKSD